MTPYRFGEELTLQAMMVYQKKHNIKKGCMTNVQYLYDTITNSPHPYSSVKAAPVICFINDVSPAGVGNCFGGHLIIETERDNKTEIIDPSYEVTSLKNKLYYKTIAEFKLAGGPIDKELIELFLTFKNLADQINDGVGIVHDKDFYNKQADFVESIHRRAEVAYTENYDVS